MRSSESGDWPPQGSHARAQPGSRFRRRQRLHERQRAHGQVRGAVAPRCLELQLHLRRCVELHAFVRKRWPGDVAAQLFELLALIRPTTHRGVRAEAVRIGETVRDFLVPAVPSSQAQHLLSGAQTRGNVISARCRLQRRQRMIRIRVRQVGHALLFDQMACARLDSSDRPRCGDDPRQRRAVVRSFVVVNYSASAPGSPVFT